MRCLRVQDTHLHLHNLVRESRAAHQPRNQTTNMPWNSLKLGRRRAGTPLIRRPMAPRTTSTALRSSYSIAAPGLLFVPSPYLSKMNNMVSQEQAANGALEYSDSEYEDEEETYDEYPLHTTTSNALKGYKSHPPGSNNALQKQNGSPHWRDSTFSGQGTDDTEEYLRQNGFDLRSSFRTGSSESYTPPTEASVSSATSDLDQRLVQDSSLRGRAVIHSSSTRARGEQYLSLQASPTPKHRRCRATTQAQADQSQESLGCKHRMGSWSPLRDDLAPLPLDIPSITAAKRNASIRVSRSSRDGRNSSQNQSPPRSSSHRNKNPSLDVLDSDTDEEELLHDSLKQSSRDTRPAQSILNVTDLRPAQATRNPSHILRFQVVPNQPSPLRTTQSTRELSTGYGIGRYVTDTRVSLSTTALPLQHLAMKKKKEEKTRGSRLGVRAFLSRCKETIMRGERRY